jgi:hypothetical protein
MLWITLLPAQTRARGGSQLEGREVSGIASRRKINEILSGVISSVMVHLFRGGSRKSKEYCGVLRSWNSASNRPLKERLGAKANFVMNGPGVTVPDHNLID